MKWYNIKYKEEYDESTIYLQDDHENYLLQCVKKLDLSKHKAIIVGDNWYTEYLNIEDYGNVYTEVTEKIKDYILNCPQVNVIGSTIYVDYELEESDINKEFEYKENQTSDYLMHISEEDWIRATDLSIEEENSLTPEELEQAEQFKQIIQDWMKSKKEINKKKISKDFEVVK